MLPTPSLAVPLTGGADRLRGVRARGFALGRRSVAAEFRQTTHDVRALLAPEGREDLLRVVRRSS